MYSSEAESFAKFLAYAERLKAADLENYCKIEVHHKTSHFQAAFFSLAGLRNAHQFLREFIGVDGTHTASRFWMNLLIASRVDANNKTLQLA